MKNTNFKKIGQRLKSARESKQITLEDAGKKIGVHKSTVLRWENGETEKIKLPILETLADYYEVNIQWLLGHDAPIKDIYDLNSKLEKLDNYMEKNNLDNIALIPVYDNINLKSNWKCNPVGHTPLDFKIQNCSEGKDYFYYKISQNSMNIEVNTYILIEATSDVNINDIILYSLDNIHIELGIYKISLQQEKNFLILGKYIK